MYCTSNLCGTCKIFKTPYRIIIKVTLHCEPETIVINLCGLRFSAAINVIKKIKELYFFSDSFVLI
jgi:hypothetical protein